MMTEPIGRERALTLLDGADTALAATLERMDDADLTAPSLCEGWSRGHVLAHLARNADALGRLVGWAVTGQEVAGYASVGARNRDIEQGAGQDLATLRTDLADASRAFRERAQQLLGREGLAEVRTGSASAFMPGDQIPWMRLREVTYHHVDLQAGFGLADANPQVVDRGLDEALSRLRGRPDCPSLTLTSTDGRRWALGVNESDGQDQPDGQGQAAAGQEVHGTPAGLLLWLARGLPTGVRSDPPVPTLPAWG